MTFGGVLMASAAGVTTFHPPFQNGSFAEVSQLLELLPELGVALGVAVRRWGWCFPFEHKKLVAKSNPTVIIP